MIVGNVQRTVTGYLHGNPERSTKCSECLLSMRCAVICNYIADDDRSNSIFESADCKQ